jgi:hypothetical protein
MFLTPFIVCENDMAKKAKILADDGNWLSESLVCTQDVLSQKL